MTTLNPATSACVLTSEQMAPLLHGILDVAMDHYAPGATRRDKKVGHRARWIAKRLERGCMIFQNFLNAPVEFTDDDQRIIYAGVLAAMRRCKDLQHFDQLDTFAAIKYLMEQPEHPYIVIP